MSIALTTATALPALLLCGFAGMVGQGIRAIIGLRKAGYLQVEKMDSTQNFSASYLMVTLMIGFIAGSLSGIAMGLDKFTTSFNTDLLLAVVAAGYSGVDFIEGSFNSRIKTAVSPYIDGTTDSNHRPTTGQGEPATLPASPVSPAPLKPSAIETVPPLSTSPLAHALLQVSPRLNADIWAPALSRAFEKFDVNSHQRIAAATGQFMVEAGLTFSELEENLRYTTLHQLMRIFGRHFRDEQEAEQFLHQPMKLANRVYANRLGNGDEASGDGYRYRGRGLIQLTGKNEYQAFASYIGMPVEEAAEWCKTPEGAAVSGCWYLKTRKCLPLADSWDLVTLTELVNGKAKVNLDDRIAISKAMLKALSSC